MNDILWKILEYVIPSLTLLIGGSILALISTCFCYFFRWLKGKASIQKHELLQQYLVTLEEIVMNAVMAKEQTLVTQLKACNGGKLSIGDQQLVKDSVVSVVHSAIPDNVLESLQSSDIDVEQLIDSFVERFVYQMKNNKVVE